MLHTMIGNHIPHEWHVAPPVWQPYPTWMTCSTSCLAAISHLGDKLKTMLATISHMDDMLHTILGNHIPHGWHVAHHIWRPYPTWMKCCTLWLAVISHMDEMLHTIFGSYIAYGCHLAHMWMTYCTPCLATISHVDDMLYLKLGIHIHIPYGWHVPHHAWQPYPCISCSVKFQPCTYSGWHAW